MSEKSKKLILAIAVFVLCLVWGRNLVLIGDASQTAFDGKLDKEFGGDEQPLENLGSYTFRAPTRDSLSLLPERQSSRIHFQCASNRKLSLDRRPSIAE